MKPILTLYGLLFTFLVCAQGKGRTTVLVNDNWQFSRQSNYSETGLWDNISLPHTWNANDVSDDVPGYYRGACWYRKKIMVDKSESGRKYFFYFEGANQVAEIFINGLPAGRHAGGYAGFCIPANALVPGQENEIRVKVDNSHDQDIPPLSADFTFYGGIYRDVWLITTGPVHFSLADHGSGGVYIRTPLVNEQQGTVQVRSIITNETQATTVQVTQVISDPKGRVVRTSIVKQVLQKGENTIIHPEIRIDRPMLWTPGTPALYQVTSEIREAASGKLLDRVNNTLGFRWFHFNPASGFYLNGKPYKLVGTSRHQDYKGLGNAVPDALAVKDIQLIKNMGGNFVRIAHYPQDPAVLKACDSLGLLASVEIPVVNEITETSAFFSKCLDMQQEMIRQHFNHPSVIIWCYMNEVLLRPHYNNDKEKQKGYYASVTALARALDSVTRAEDPGRYTMMAHHGDFNKYRNTGLVDIPMIVGWNLYSGWYGGALRNFPEFLDTFHKRYPDKPMMVAEYGADADPRVRSNDPVRFDKSVEYTTAFHQYYLVEMLKRPFVAGAVVWNLADFNSETRSESMPHINNKGLLEWDRNPKDPYYYYQAMLHKEPFIKLLGPSQMAGMIDSSGNRCHHKIQAATNATEAELFVNGVSAGKSMSKDGLADWVVYLQNGRNELEVRTQKNGTVNTDSKRIDYTGLPYRIDTCTAFTPLNILLGAKRSYLDASQQLWIPDQAYHTGSWGHLGGSFFRQPNNDRLPYGSDRNIINTFDDPVYQTQQVGLKQYRFDPPPGEYEVKLHFAELMNGQSRDVPYNLSDPERISPNGRRIFNVYVNGNLILDNFDMTAQYGSATAIVKTVLVTVEPGRSIVIDFKSVEGEPVLNALQLKRLSADHPQVNAGK